MSLPPCAQEELAYEEKYPGERRDRDFENAMMEDLEKNEDMNEVGDNQGQSTIGTLFYKHAEFRLEQKENGESVGHFTSPLVYQFNNGKTEHVSIISTTTSSVQCTSHGLEFKSHTATHAKNN